MRTMFFFNNVSAARFWLAAFLLALPLGWAVAQDDDVYFVPKKKDKTTKTQAERNNVQIIYVDDEDTSTEPVYTANPRDVDEYNRRSKTQRGYTLPGSDTLYVMSDSTVVTTRSLANDVYSYGYDEGFSDGQDYAYSQRLSRFGYSSIYASPWYFHCFDPWYYDPWYYDPYWYGGYYGRPYWSAYWGWGGYYGGYYGGYHGWYPPHHHPGWGPGHIGHHGGNFVDRGGHNGRTPGSTGRTTTSIYRGGRGGESLGRGYSIGGSDSRQRGYSSSYGGTRSRGTDGIYNRSGSRSGNHEELGGVRPSRSSSSGTFSGGGRSSGGSYSGGSTRSSGSSGSFGGGRSGGSGGGGGRAGGGGGRSGGGGRGGR